MRFALLGPLVVVGDPGRQAPLAGPRLRVLLAALLLRANTPVSADALAEAIWDGQPTPAAIETLRSYVRRLRRVLGPEGGTLIQARDPGYLICLQEADLDVLEFEALCREAAGALRAGAWGPASDAASRALGLWRGPPLLDVPSQLLHDQIVPRLEQLQLQAVEDRAEAGLHLGCYEELVPQLRELTVQHPLRERFHAQLMIALYRCGRQAEALATYQQVRKVLVDELGVEPGVNLRNLHQRILAGDPTLASQPQSGDNNPFSDAQVLVRPSRQHNSSKRQESQTVPQCVPAAPRYFVGRTQELKALFELAGNVGDHGTGNGPVVVTISGTAGAGKTAVAVHWAQQAAQMFPDGQLYIDLRGFGPTEPLPPAQALLSFLSAMDARAAQPPTSLDESRALYCHLLAGKKMLVVLDNAHDPAQARPLLPSSPGCMAVVTSRNELTGLVAADGALPLVLDSLTAREAHQLLKQRIGAARTAVEPTAVTDLIRLCSGLPLALSIVAARAVTRPRFALAVLAAELRDADSRLDALNTGEDATDIRTVVSWSYQKLSAPAAQIFRLLCLHPGPDITASAAASLVGLPLAKSRTLLRELTRCHMLTEPTPGRYALHDLLRDYGAEQSKPNGRVAIHRVLDYYLHCAHSAAMLLNPSRASITLNPPQAGVTLEKLADRREALDWLEAEHRVLLSVAILATEAGFDIHTWQLPWTMSEFLDHRGQWQEWTGVQHAALDAASRLGDMAGQAVANGMIAHTCARLGDYDQAAAHLMNSAKLWQKLGDRAREAAAHQNLSAVFVLQSRYNDALHHSTQALALAETAGNRERQAAALNAVGFHNSLLGNHRQALAFCQRALTMNRELGNRLGEANSWDSLGHAECNLGHFNDAAACYQQAVAIFRDLGSRFNQAESLDHLGEVYRAANQPQQARDAWRQALNILDDLHHPHADQICEKLRHSDRT